MTTLLDLVDFRERCADDLNFIRSSWLKSYAPTVRRVVPRDTFMALHWEVAMGLIDRPNATVVIACAKSGEGDTDDEKASKRHQIIGWAAGELQASRAWFHYVYVKDAFRRGGIAKALVAQVFEDPPTIGAFPDDTGGDWRGRIIARSKATATHLPNEKLRKRLEAVGWSFRPQYAFYLAAEGAT